MPRRNLFSTAKPQLYAILCSEDSDARRRYLDKFHSGSAVRMPFSSTVGFDIAKRQLNDGSQLNLSWFATAARVPSSSYGPGNKVFVGLYDPCNKETFEQMQRQLNELSKDYNFSSIKPAVIVAYQLEDAERLVSNRELDDYAKLIGASYIVVEEGFNESFSVDATSAGAYRGDVVQSFDLVAELARSAKMSDHTKDSAAKLAKKDADGMLASIPGGGGPRQGTNGFCSESHLSLLIQ